MITLALESSTILGSVALFQDRQQVYYDECFKQRSHSEFMNAAIARGLQVNGLTIKNLSQILVSKGPGSFTGLRVSSAIAKTLAYSLGKKIWTIDSLRIIKAQFDEIYPQFAPQQILISMNAFKNLAYFTGFYNSQQIAGTAVFDIDRLGIAAKALFNEKGVHLVGDLAKSLDLGPHFLTTVYDELSLLHPRADALGRLFFSQPNLCQTYDWNSFLPLYLRGSEAEENLRLRE